MPRDLKFWRNFRSPSNGSSSDLDLPEWKATSISGGTDIVFIHGLRGTRLGTWTSKGAEAVCWPRDLLKDDLENARVIAWGYDASVARIFHASSQESIFGHADTLLEDLAQLRAGITRPIVFVCHSLGGLVVKQALIKAANYMNNNRHPSLGAIYSSTNGVVFMGTPHRGSSKEAYADVLIRIAKVTLRQPNEQLLRTLRQDSHILENQRDDFTTISQSMSIICIREELPTGIGVIVPESSASYDGFNVRRGSINANHMDMARFTSSTETGYQRTLGYIRDVCTFSMPTQQVTTRNAQKIKKEILESLRYSTINEWREAIAEPYDGTCDWIMDDPNPEADPATSSGLMDWLKSEEPLFWISGKAGCGKSTVMGYIHEHHKVEESLRGWAGGQHVTKAAFFFREQGKDLESSREGMLRSILHQILNSRQDLIPTAFPMLFMEDETFIAEDLHVWPVLKAAFNALLSSSERFKLMLVVDGLDEFRMHEKRSEYTEEQKDLLYDGENEDEAWGTNAWITDGHKHISEFLLEFRRSSKVKVCFACRELNIFEQRFSTLPRIRVHQHTQGAIREYCDRRPSDEAPELEDRDMFVDSVTRQSQGVFVWVRLIMNTIIDGYLDGNSSEALKRHLVALPSRLGGRNGLYMHMMRNIKREYLVEASQLFQLVGHWEAFRCVGQGVSTPLDIILLFLSAEGLTVTDFERIATARKEKVAPQSWEELEPRWKELQRRLRSRCGGLLEGSESVTFMHLTARQFVSRGYMWEALAVSRRRWSPPDLDLALLSGIVRRVKISAHVITEFQMLAKWKLGDAESWRLGKSIFIGLFEALEAACRLAKMGERVENYEGLLDELDPTYGKLWDLAKADLPRIPDGVEAWTNLLLASNHGSYGFLELATTLHIEHYVIAKLRGQPDISQERLQTLLAASLRVPFLMCGEPSPHSSWRRSIGPTVYVRVYVALRRSTRIVEMLLAWGADPNGNPNRIKGPQTTEWTLFLGEVIREVYLYRTTTLFYPERQMAFEANVIGLFLQYGANRDVSLEATVRGQLQTSSLEDLAKRLLEEWREFGGRDSDFPRLQALIPSGTD